MLPQRLPDAEFEIMEYIWDATPPVTTSQAMESVGRAHGWKIQTLATLFKRLTSGDSCAQSAEREENGRFTRRYRARNICGWRRNASSGDTISTAMPV